MAQNIKLAIFDFDGVFTDGNIYFDQQGNPIKKYNTRDAVGLRLLKNCDIKIGVVSGYKDNNSQRKILEHLECDYISLGSPHEKLETIKEWACNLDISLQHVSFMGDDHIDLESLTKVGFSGCPKDAARECLEIVDFISEKKGGEGCIREFCEEVVKRRNKLTISGLICVKYHSSRLPFKNIRKFGNTTLLDLKIKKLLSLDFLDEVIINTDSPYIINYVRTSVEGHKKLRIVKRNSIYATDSVDNREFARAVVSQISNQYVLYSPVTMPFIEKNTYKKMYTRICGDHYDSVVLIADGEQGGGHQHEKHNFCFGASIMKVSDVKLYGDFIGERPYFQECMSKERLDIDYDWEFNSALYHYFNKDAIYGKQLLPDNALYNLNLTSPITQFTSKRNLKGASTKKTQVKILDATIRDGGFDNKWNWAKKEVIQMLKCASDTGIDYFEIGYLVNDSVLEKDDGHYRNVSFDTIQEIFTLVEPKCKISILIDYWRYDINNLPPKKKTKIDLVRVVTYMDSTKVREAIEVCRKIKEKGYETSLNIMCASYFDNKIIEDIKRQVKQNKEVFNYLYFADSYGAMEPKKVEYVFSKVQDIRQMGIDIGFHIHNNGHIGMVNMISSLKYVDIIDGSYNGIGRGMGNVRLEDVILYLTLKRSYKFALNTFLDFIDNTFPNPAEVKNTLLGFLNIHPYRIRDFPVTASLRKIYTQLSQLSVEKRYNYQA